MRQTLRHSRRATDQQSERDIFKRELSRPRRALIEFGQDINHGWIEDLSVRNCEPVLEPLPAYELEITFRRENGPRSELSHSDFILKAQFVEMFEFFDQRKDFVIRRLEFKHGLPFRMFVKEAAA